MKTHLIGIAAMDPNRVIGKGLTIPWHYSEDFKFFKRTTLGYPIVMGRATYESIGKPLPGRRNIVVSNTMDVHLPDVTVIRNGVTGVLNFAKEYETWAKPLSINPELQYNKAFIIGGAKLFADTIEYMSNIYITHIKKEYDGDIFMPDFEHLFYHEEDIMENDDFVISSYTRL